MTSRTAAPALRLLLAALGMALLAALAVLGGASPALAHDHLVSSDPADGAQLETSPEQITLTFSDDIMDVTPVVKIVDGDGATVLEETPAIDGTDAVLALGTPLAAGDYTVQWRVVSSDGHPIEGSFAISVAAGAAEETAASDAGASDGTASEEPSAEATAETTAAAASTEPAAASTDGSDALLPVFIGLGAIVVIGVVIALRAGRRDPNGPSGQH